LSATGRGVKGSEIVPIVAPSVPIEAGSFRPTELNDETGQGFDDAS
jgi:hypothetical protein